MSENEKTDIPKVTADEKEEGDDKKYTYILHQSRHLPKFKFNETKKKEHVVVKGAEGEKSEDESDSSESIDEDEELQKYDNIMLMADQCRKSGKEAEALLLCDKATEIREELENVPLKLRRRKLQNLAEAEAEVKKGVKLGKVVKDNWENYFTDNAEMICLILMSVGLVYFIVICW